MKKYSFEISLDLTELGIVSKELTEEDRCLLEKIKKYGAFNDEGEWQEE